MQYSNYNRKYEEVEVRKAKENLFNLMLIIITLFSILFFAKYGIGVILTTIGMVYYSYRYIYLHNQKLDQAKKWEKVDGEILKKRLIRVANFFDRACAGYLPKITYRYDYNGESYTSSNLSLADRYVATHDKEEAQNFMKSLFKDEKIIVYVNPKNPTETYIYDKYHERDKNSYLVPIISSPPLIYIAFLLYEKANVI